MSSAAARPKRPMARVMVVDDDADTLAILSHHLKREGFEPIAADSGASCLRMAREHQIDVILLDLMMPEMDGFEVCCALKAHPETAEIPIVMVTARDDIDARAEAMRLGISDFLAKPVSRGQLVSAITAQIELVAATRSTDAALERLQKAGASGAPRKSASSRP
jgi:CheY-like chemotaxis protein